MRKDTILRKHITMDFRDLPKEVRLRDRVFAEAIMRLELSFLLGVYSKSHIGFWV